MKASEVRFEPVGTRPEVLPERSGGGWEYPQSPSEHSASRSGCRATPPGDSGSGGGFPQMTPERLAGNMGWLQLLASRFGGSGRRGRAVSGRFAGGVWSARTAMERFTRNRKGYTGIGVRYGRSGACESAGMLLPFASPRCAAFLGMLSGAFTSTATWFAGPPTWWPHRRLFPSRFASFPFRLRPTNYSHGSYQDPRTDPAPRPYCPYQWQLPGLEQNQLACTALKAARII